MDMTGNCILVTGGATGIGRRFAELFHARGNRVIVASRRRSALDAVVAANPGMSAMELDVADPAIHDWLTTDPPPREPGIRLGIGPDRGPIQS